MSVTKKETIIEKTITQNTLSQLQTRQVNNNHVPEDSFINKKNKDK